MQKEFSEDRGWLIITLSGNAVDTTDQTWHDLRSAVPWERCENVVCDVSGMLGATDRMVEILVGMTVDAQHRGRRFVLVGVSEELRARFGVMGVARYVTVAANIEEARMMLPTAL